ncbi:MAG: prepilin-type N-terminal cleavage/methylation domain-containing protein [Chthonomonas sp.]|nr:prepilin-type N-terminal cleavage/methylation domain-containing protein [Chthonomonas sp.]
MRRRAFTLLELITVMALTAVLMGLVVYPLIQSFDITRAGQGFADAQNRARILIERITREVGNAAFVRDNTGDAGSVYIDVPASAATPNNFVRIRLENSRLDIMAPAQGDPTPSSQPGGGLINPDTGRVDPTLKTPKGDVNLPVTEGLRLVRYFVGLREPVQGTRANPLPARYFNPYDGVLNRRAGGQDNLYVLWRAEVDIRQFNNATSTWQINTELFDVDGDGTATPRELEQALDDPNFFNFSIPLADINNPANVALAQRQRDFDRIRAWMKRSRIVTEFSRYDMIQVSIDKASRAIQTFVDPIDGVTKPRITSLVEFTPTRVSGEPMGGLLAVRSGEESDNSAKIGPDVFSADFGFVTSPILRVRPSSYRDLANAIVAPWTPYESWINGRPYLVSRDRPNGGFSQFYFVSGNDLTAGTEVFDNSGYTFARDYDRGQPLPPDPDTGVATTGLFRYPYSWAIDKAVQRAGGTNLLNTAAMREDFVPTVLDRKQGKVIASFGINEVGTANALPPGVDDNRPVADCGQAVPPAQDVLVTGGSPSNQRWAAVDFNPALASSHINQRFNVLWNDWQLLAPNLEKSQLVRRFVDLRVTPQVDGAASPLDPRQGFARARMVPGSEIVIGPDQTPGTNYGQPVRYTRVPVAGNVGPNQYFINYVNQREPDWQQLGFTVDPQIFNPTYYDDAGGNWSNRFVSQILQPRYRAGYIEFNSMPGEPLPSGRISVFYRFQFTETKDVFELDYDSRQLMNIALTIRNFPQTSAPNQQNVTVRGQANVRNLLR